MKEKLCKYLCVFICKYAMSKQHVSYMYNNKKSKTKNVPNNNKAARVTTKWENEWGVWVQVQKRAKRQAI